MHRGDPAPLRMAPRAFSALSLGLHVGTAASTWRTRGLLPPGWKPATPREMAQQSSQNHQDGGKGGSPLQWFAAPRLGEMQRWGETGRCNTVSPRPFPGASPTLRLPPHRNPAAVSTPTPHMRARAPPVAQRGEAPVTAGGGSDVGRPPSPCTDSHVGLGTLASQRNTVTFSQEIL